LSVSESHASIRADADGYAILDHGSTNGTKVNGGAVSASRKRRLADGDRIELGLYQIQFHAGVPIARPASAERTAELARRLFRQGQRSDGRASPRLVVVSPAQAGKTLLIPEPPARSLVGSAAHCQLVLADPEVAPEHCELRRDLDGVLVRQLDGSRALAINGHAVSERRLRDGDALVLGSTELMFEDPTEGELQALTGRPDVKLAPAPDAPAGSAPATADEAPARPAPPPSARRPSFDADVLVYTLAALIIAASVLGLIALMQD
jgi:pSer/pThr/pTyr-binding forkhead associated (FHA) protein